LRPTRTSIAASAVYLAIGLLWVFGTRPPGQPALELGWLAAVAVAGAFVPGLANQVSLVRAYLAAPALVYALAPGGLGLLAVTMAIAGLSDLVDGTIARRLESPSSLGGGLDPVIDGIFLGAAAVGLAVGGAFPLWLACVVIVRYLLPAVAAAVLLLARRPIQIRHTLTGQVTTLLILVLVGAIVLLRALNQDPGNFVIGAEVVIPIAALATFVHLGLTLRQPASEPGRA
jgi:cardiolipin synthase (CMP-forming)